ncbi:MAG: glyoxalase/bleomycin resistance/dioxygenase family protein [Proteobacteria bacterium]|nr:glyoxalase/bleomycin resistance/dioxygenase family protein [Pseudomonadota bacterium]MBU1612182.1 glyoxalase/bleomycin resistance/dioxygenase family protein [Pseudomonadota bacterium]
MKITFEGPAVLVSDINRSRLFYEQVLGQEVLADHGPHVAFKNGFSIWFADHAVPIVSQGAKMHSGSLAHDNFELYFECAEIDEAWAKTQEAGAEPIHGIIVQPWLQKGFRISDPDGHIVEVGEPLPALVKRLMAQGMSADEVHEKTSIPKDAVLAMAQG